MSIYDTVVCVLLVRPPLLFLLWFVVSCGRVVLWRCGPFVPQAM